MAAGRKIRKVATRRPRRAHTGAAASPPGEFSSPACYLHELDPPAAASGSHGFGIKRIYDRSERGDGFRVLIDRLWPRGVSRQRAALDAWLTELAPSTGLRTWFHHDPSRWSEFARRYRAELRAQQEQLEVLRQRARRQRVTLLYGARDPHRNHALVLQAVLQQSRRT